MLTYLKKMFIKSIIFFCVANVLVQISVNAQSCSDCTIITSCPKAFAMLQSSDEATTRQLRDAFCGFEGSVPRVCCSQVSPATNNVNLDNHPNLNLLPNECGSVPGKRIFGGKEVGLYDYPWMVLISYKTRDGLQFQCGGTLINNRYILTAAHCIVGLKIAGVRVGEHDIRTDTDCQGQGAQTVCERRLQDIRVEKAIPHENYQPKPNVANDIGLLRLKSPVNFAPENARPICLPITAGLRNKNIGGQQASVAGWGYTENGYASPVLLAVEVPVYTKEACQGLYNRGRPSGVDDTLNKICAGENGKDSCGGDSGGPLMVEGQHNGKDRYIQHGVVSYGPRLCASNFPGVYTDVTKYMDWILDNIKP